MTTNKNYLLTIDNGTQSVRALLFDTEGNLVDKTQVMMSTYQSPNAGWVENDPEEFWRALCSACQQLWAKTAVPKSAVRALTITTQRATVINLDADGKPLRPAIIWLDQRRATTKSTLPWYWNGIFSLIGMTDSIKYFHAEAEANWIAQHQPEIWARTDKYLLLSGYLNHRFTGKFVDSVASQVGYLPFDFKSGKWAAANDWKWLSLPV